jgi:putative ABC transport system permease protein
MRLGKKTNKPPKLPEYLMSRMFPDEDFYTTISDLEEEFLHLLSEKGSFYAKLWYWLQLLPAFAYSFTHKTKWSFIMFKNYLKIAFRNLKRQKGFSFINITGLSIGMACSILIFMYVFYEFSYDRFYENSENIYLVANKGFYIDFSVDRWTSTPALLAGELRNNYPEIKQVTRVNFQQRSLITANMRNFFENEIIASDKYFFQVFSHEFITGNPETALKDPNSAVISQQIAEKYFGTENPYGKNLSIGNNDFNITGVIKNVPRNTHLYFEIIISNHHITWLFEKEQSWLNISCTNYLTLQENYSPAQLEAKLDILVKKNIKPLLKEKNNWWRMYLQPLSDIYLYYQTKISNVYIFLSIGVFILLIACINFVNLSTARYTGRAREVGIRKVIGSKRTQLIKQFLSESVLLSLISLILAVILIHAFFPFYSDLINRPLDINFLYNFKVLLCLAGLALFVGVISGIYPAFFLSSFKSVSILKSGGYSTPKNGVTNFRNCLVVFQFIISIFLFIATAVIFKQLQYSSNADLGFDKEQVVVLRNIRLIGEKAETIKIELSKYREIENLSFCASVPGTGRNRKAMIPEDNVKTTLNLNYIDSNYLTTLKIKLTAGRNFKKSLSPDKNSIIINEEAVKQFGRTDPIGKMLTTSNGDAVYTVIGVVKDFHYNSLKTTIENHGFLIISDESPWQKSLLAVRLKDGNLSETVKLIENVWTKVSPDVPFKYFFLSDRLNTLYRNEKRDGKTAAVFSFLAIFISCLGLFGLASFITEKRRKEVGIRKTFGASASNLVCLLTVGFLKLVLIANIIAWPIGYFTMNKWLQNFAYRIQLGAGIFIISTLITFLITLFTLSYRTIKAAHANPVDSLRNE